MNKTPDNLTSFKDATYNPFQEDGFVKGTILCQKCHSKIDTDTMVCPKCEAATCFIRLYYKGQHWNYRRNFDGDVFNYPKAFKFLKYIQQEIDRLRGDFNPQDFTDIRLKDRLFENKYEQWIEEKEKEVTKGKRSPEYLRILQSYNRKWFVSLIGKDVRDIKKATLKDLSDKITGKSKTVKNIMDGLRTFFNWLYDNGIIETVPPFPSIEIDDAEVRYAFDVQAQIEALEQIPSEHRDIFMFEAETGLRPGEACAILIGDVDFFQNVACIQHNFSGKHFRPVTKQKRKYVIPLSDKAMEIAHSHAKNRLPLDFLFLHPTTGQHYTRKTLGEIWNRSVDTRLKHYEGTRHSFCTQLVDAEVNPLQAKDLMRHTTLKTTEHYYHGNIKMLRGALAKRTKVIELNRTEIEPKVQEN